MKTEKIIKNRIKKNNKIVISTYDSIDNPFYNGGGAFAIHEVAKRLSKKYELIVLTGNYPGSINKVKDGVSYKRIGVFLWGPRVSQLLFHLTLPFYVLKESYDLWIESFTPPFSTSFLQFYTKKPVIGLVHMLSASDMKRKYFVPLTLVEKIGLKCYRRFIVLTETQREKITRINKQAAINVIPNGVKIPKQNFNKEKHILFIGRIEINQKGLDLLINAIAEVKKHLNFKLIIAGDGNKKEEKELIELIKSKKLQDNVKLVGRVEGTSKEKLFQDAIVVVCPSRFETFSLVALETFSYAKTLVCFDIDGLKWIPESIAIKVKRVSSRSLSNALIKILKDDVKRASIGKRAYKFARNYDWNSVSEKYDEFISEELKNYYIANKNLMINKRGNLNEIISN